MELPQSLYDAVLNLLKEKIGSSITKLHFVPLPGGCINYSGKLSTSAGDFFLKYNDDAKFPRMLETESYGLMRLSSINAIRIPRVVAVGHAHPHQFLILEFVAQNSPSKYFWRNLGEGLAFVHRDREKLFGFEHDNYIGSLQQYNGQYPSWIKFFIEQRLVVQMTSALSAGLIDARVSRKFEALFQKLEHLLVDEAPSLLHGDLWRGNVISDEKGGPCLIDPAVYYGNREADLAMTQLFGGFDSKFLEAYQNNFPLAPGYEERFEIYNLYPLLVHLNLFGPSYVNQVLSILKKHATQKSGSDF
jgi:protein-ribulosamine 3-kinase